MPKAHPTRTERACQTCGRTFLVLPWEDKRRGGVKYCSRACYHKSQAIPLETHFLRGVGAKTDAGCVLWAGIFDAKGYGIIYSSTHRRGQRTFLAHRVAWELTHRKLTSEAVAAIRDRYRRGGVSQQQLADEYSVDQTTISKVVRGQAWNYA